MAIFFKACRKPESRYDMKSCTFPFLELYYTTFWLDWTEVNGEKLSTKSSSRTMTTLDFKLQYRVMEIQKVSQQHGQKG